MPWVHVAVDVPHAQLKVEVAERIVANWTGSGGGGGDLSSFFGTGMVAANCSPSGAASRPENPARGVLTKSQIWTLIWGAHTPWYTTGAQRRRCLSWGNASQRGYTFVWGGRTAGVQSLYRSAPRRRADCVMASYSWEAASHLRPCTRSLGSRERHQVSEEVARLLVELLVGLLKVEAHGRVLGDGDVGVVREELEKVCFPARDLRHLHVRDP